MTPIEMRSNRVTQLSMEIRIISWYQVTHAERTVQQVLAAQGRQFTPSTHPQNHPQNHPQHDPPGRSKPKPFSPSIICFPLHTTNAR